jgi:hypothetical protein
MMTFRAPAQISTAAASSSSSSSSSQSQLAGAAVLEKVQLVLAVPSSS